jgi:hypothetical protein
MIGADRNITARILPLGDWDPVIPIPAFSAPAGRTPLGFFSSSE